MLLEDHEAWAARSISQSVNSQHMSSQRGYNDTWLACMCNNDMELGPQMPVKKKRISNSAIQESYFIKI